MDHPREEDKAGVGIRNQFSEMKNSLSSGVCRLQMERHLHVEIQSTDLQARLSRSGLSSTVCSL